MVNDILGKEGNDTLGESPIAMKSNIEGYLGSLNSYDEVHRNLINVLCGGMDLNSPERGNTVNIQEHLTISNNFGSKLSLKLGAKLLLKIRAKNAIDTGLHGRMQSRVGSFVIAGNVSQNSGNNDTLRQDSLESDDSFANDNTFDLY